MLIIVNKWLIITHNSHSFKIPVKNAFAKAKKKCGSFRCTSDVAHGGARCAQGTCVYAQTHEKLEGTLVWNDRW